MDVRDLVKRYVVPRRSYDALEQEHHRIVGELRRTYETWVPPGHFYSPHVDLEDVAARSAEIFDPAVRPAGIDLQAEAQIELFEQFAPLVQDLQFPAVKGDDYRSYFDNPAYSWADGIVLHGMLRHLAPQRVVEVGSGYSSALILDTVDGWLPGATDLVFVEPYPELLKSMLRPGDNARVTIHARPVQDVPLETFSALEAGDLLFIDSTHVVKAGSDVNRLFFDVLPSLQPGVWVHLHDIFFPFEYPEPWVREGRAWQEAYLLRAFLMFNPQFEVRWFQHYMWTQQRPLLETQVPLMAKNPGANIWLQRV